MLRPVYICIDKATPFLKHYMPTIMPYNKFSYEVVQPHVPPESSNILGINNRKRVRNEGNVYTKVAPKSG